MTHSLDFLFLGNDHGVMDYAVVPTQSQENHGTYGGQNRANRLIVSL